MKRLFAALVVVILAMGLIGCSSESSKKKVEVGVRTDGRDKAIRVNPDDTKQERNEVHNKTKEIEEVDIEDADELLKEVSNNMRDTTRYTATLHEYLDRNGKQVPGGLTQFTYEAVISEYDNIIHATSNQSISIDFEDGISTSGGKSELYMDLDTGEQYYMTDETGEDMWFKVVSDGIGEDMVDSTSISNMKVVSASTQEGNTIIHATIEANKLNTINGLVDTESDVIEKLDVELVVDNNTKMLNEIEMNLNRPSIKFSYSMKMDYINVEEIEIPSDVKLNAFDLSTLHSLLEE